MNTEINYKTALQCIGQGLKQLSYLLPKTFATNMNDIILHHYVFLAFIVAVISLQAYSYINVKKAYDKSNRDNAQLEQRLDSAVMRDVKYTSYNYNPNK